MKTYRALPVLAAAALIISMVPAAAGAARAGSVASPSLVRGPQAIPANVAGPNYGLFSCQVGLSTGQCYDPYQMRHAYGVDNLIAAGFTGKGETIIIVDAYQSPNIVAQLNYFDTFYGLPGLNGLGTPYDKTLGTFKQIAPGGLTAFDPTDGNMSGWAEEISLDVLWAHAMAPGANIVLDLAKSNDDADILAATKYAVDHRLGDVISQSFGEAESCVDPKILAQEHQVFAKATLEGMTLFASSGDEGAAQATCDGNSWIKSASSPASDPLVTGVGGTELVAADYCLATLGCDPTKNPAPGTYQSETAWNEGAPFGDFVSVFGEGTLASGGGFSTIYREPSYQKSAIHSNGKQRGVPDIAYNAAVMHGVLTYLNIPGIPVGFYRFGGTSAGSPQWAAIMAIADQKARHDLGFINSALYEIGDSSKTYAAGLHDIKIGTNSAVECVAYDALGNCTSFVTITGYNAGKGWDATTGLGTPKADQLVSYLIKYVSWGDGVAAVAESSPYFGNYPWWGGHQRPH
jgi:subtilase family serine protease